MSNGEFKSVFEIQSLTVGRKIFINPDAEQTKNILKRRIKPDQQTITQSALIEIFRKGDIAIEWEFVGNDMFVAFRLAWEPPISMPV